MFCYVVTYSEYMQTAVLLVHCYPSMVMPIRKLLCFLLALHRRTIPY